MRQARRFLCPVDFSEVSLKAARYAAALAADCGGSLKLLYVYYVPPHLSSVGAPRHFADLSPQQLAELQACLDNLQSELSGSGLSVETAFAVGSPAEQVIKAAQSEPADIIVLGAEGGGVGQRLLGGLAERVLRSSPVPVLAVPA